VKVVKLNIFLASLIVSVAFSCPARAQQTNPESSGSKTDSQPVDSDEELRRAIESSGGSETQIIINLEEYLKKFPKSASRTEIENELYKLSLKVRDRDRAISYAEKSISKDADNIDMLTSLVGLLRERRADGDLNKALGYADRLVKQVEAILSTSRKPGRLSASQWADQKERGLASVYLLRGRIQADLNNDQKAEADLLKSYQSTRLAGASLVLAELSEKRKKIDEAIDYYLQAFVVGLNTDEEIDLKSVRSKLGQLYASKNGNEVGLGDRVLKTYDAYLKERSERIARLEPPNINAGITDPLSFKLTKIDGSKLEMNSLRGKVLVINFWATWCGPCITELPLFQKAMAKYKDDKDVVFLAVTTDDDRESVAPFLKEHGFNLPVVFAEYLDNHFSVNSIPTTIILDRTGQVSYRQGGYNPRVDFGVMLSEKIETAKKK
jgi:thiol-disulfide isomerase/thioredoxin